MLRRNRHAVRIEQNAQRRHHRVVIQQRLALAHQHDIRLRLERGAIVFERHEHLPDDFARGEIANQAQRGRQAEIGNPPRSPPASKCKSSGDFPPA